MSDNASLILIIGIVVNRIAKAFEKVKEIQLDLQRSADKDDRIINTAEEAQNDIPDPFADS